jgi:hypothetical protein
MKRIVPVIFAFLLAGSVFAQKHEATPQDVNRFFNTKKTYVVLENNPISSYNFKLQQAIKDNWTITDYEFIPHTEFEELRRDPNNSFLMMTQVVFDKDKTKTRYDFLNLMLGEKTYKWEDMTDLVAVPLSYTEVDEEYWVYKLETLIRFIQNHMLTLKKDPDLVDEDLFKYYRDNIKSIKNKTLYLVQDELEESINTLSKIQDVYPYRVKLASREEIEKVIENREKNAVFLHKVGPYGTRLKARCYKIIIGAEDANFYYFDMHNIVRGKRPDGLLEKDLKKMSK